MNNQITLENDLSTNNEKGMELMNKGEYEGARFYFNKALDSVYELDPSLKTITKEKKAPINRDSPLNNLSWAYNELGEFEKSLEYIKKSLLILPNTDVEYVNEGNAYYGLNQFDSALIDYDKAIALNANDKSAYYGKGMVAYDSHKYEEAVKQFDKYLSLDENDTDALLKIAYSHLNLDEVLKAQTYANLYVQKLPDAYEGYKLRADIVNHKGNYEITKEYYQTVAEKFPDNPEAQKLLGELYYENKRYDQSIDHFNKLLAKHPDDMDLYDWIMDNEVAKGDFESLHKTCEKAAKQDGTNPDLYTKVGNLYLNNGYYRESVDYFSKAIMHGKSDEKTYTIKLKALYLSKKNTQCVEFGKTAKNSLSSISTSDIDWYMGKCNFELGNYQDAAANFIDATIIDPKDDEAFSDLAFTYFSLGNYKLAKDYSSKSLDLNTENALALYVKNGLVEKELPLGQQVKKFFTDHYLYADSMDDLDQSLARLDDANISVQEIANVIDKAKKKDDIFTFTVYGDEYDRLQKESEHDLTYKEEGGICYFRINTFAINTDDKFIDALDSIPDKESKVLVIDLRGNSGGLSDSSNHILDALLPNLVTSTLIYKDGYTDSYYSDASQTKFKKIDILIDENTASASELLALGLKTYLKNVTVIGRDSFGKGVGQQVFEDKKNKLMVFVVSFYWNVKQTNIMNEHVKPDIYIKGNDLASFMKAVKS
ncbi:S41 family peptidase [Gorillibacterium massiliense]|uniref:S41 family peptidase n=1 Tax=Gorillibacterium massiliense TaxID=1280390 RepID=UPI0004B72875|nr:tetratricopeptide repeat protein [Gorillibacterium massiliense]